MNVLQPYRVRELSERDVRESSPVLSVYLNLDPSNPVNRRSGHKLAVDAMLKDIEAQIVDDARLRHFHEDAEWVRQKSEFLLPKGKSCVLFCDVSESFYLEEDLPIRMANQAWYGQTPYVRPLMEALDEYERYGVALIDREKARLFVITMGNIEEVSDVFQEPPVKHRSTAGSDHMRSQMVLQRRAAKWSESFLKGVADTLHEIIQDHAIDRIILAGPEEVTAEFQRLLPKGTAAHVVDRVRMSVTAKAREVLDVSFPFIERMEREQEQGSVRDLITIAQKTKPTMEKAVLGLNSTLSAVNQGRVHRLFYASGTKIKGFQCVACDVLLDYAPADGKCPYCSNLLEEIDDMTWLASERVLTMGGKAEEIRGEEARAQLTGVGGIGAYLR